MMRKKEVTPSASKPKKVEKGLLLKMKSNIEITKLRVAKLKREKADLSLR